MSSASPLAVTVSRVIRATPEELYDRISDVTQMGTYSPENVRSLWINGATSATVGARFKGKNKLGPLSWSTKPAVIVADRGRQFTFQVPGASGPLWTYTFEQVADGTLVTESMRQNQPSPAVIRFMQRRAGVKDRAENLRDGMTETLARVAAIAEAA
jgi:uncharacterized protein YndB with AHSA1/START domain